MSYGPNQQQPVVVRMSPFEGNQTHRGCPNPRCSAMQSIRYRFVRRCVENAYRISDDDDDKYIVIKECVVT